MTGEEIRARLSAFAARWSIYSGSERAEAQTFCNELFACYGVQRRDFARFEEPQAGRFLDLIWPGVCIIEMKAPSEAGRLERHREQALDYWRSSASVSTGVGAPPYVVLCAFCALEIWKPGEFPAEPVLKLDLVDLPERYDALLFMAGGEPVFSGGHVSVTRDAVTHLTGIYQRLKDRDAAAPDVLRDFLLQSVWCLFAEDLAQIPEHRFIGTVDALIASPSRSSADDLHQLFATLNTPGPRPTHGIGRGVPYANGGLFERPASVHLQSDELVHLRAAAEFSWRDVEPAIFGSLLEGALGEERRDALGAHYTHAADIQKVVQPTIVEPWLERIDAISTLAQARAAQDDLTRFVVLDPACGSGNFLYVAYRELRRLEQRLRAREQELRDATGASSRRLAEDQQAIGGLFFPIANMRGIEIETFAVQLARVTLWMGHKLAVEELELDEATLPLADLSGIQVGDALRMHWPRADAIVGNPPFHGSQHLRRELGSDYVAWLKAEFGIGVKELCVYWFRRAHDALESGGRAGLVGTNSISQNRARSVSLDYIVDNGGTITNAVSSQPWPGEAAVHVSIVNWTRHDSVSIDAMLDGESVSGITSALKSGIDLRAAATLSANRGRCFQGAIPADDGGFLMTGARAAGFIDRAGEPYRQVVRPFLTARDITTDPQQRPSRWAIDFGTRTLEEAGEFPLALEIVRARVKPFRESMTRSIHRDWWLFARPRPEMRRAFEGLHRFLGLACHGKRIVIAWFDPVVLPSNAVMAFALDSDYAFGILSSRAHVAWATAKDSTIKGDPRYTPTSSFATFPWPSAPPDGARDLVGHLGQRLNERRGQLCQEHGIGLTQLYNGLDEGAYSSLKRLHRDLDEAVAGAYGWPVNAASDAGDSNRRLLQLNRSIAAGATEYHPFD